MKKIFFSLTAAFVFLLTGCLDLTGTQDPVLYSVKYHANGADSGSVPVDENKYSPEASVIIAGNKNKLIYNGYTLEGWSLSPVGHAEFFEGSTMVMGNADVLLYAIWKPEQTVSGTVTIPTPVDISLSAPSTVMKGDLLTVSAPQGFESYSWYINGLPIIAEVEFLSGPNNEAALSVHTISFPPELFEIMVIAVDAHGVKTSASTRVQILN